MNIHEWQMSKQKKAIDKLKQIYGKDWKNELKIKWRTGVYNRGLDSDEIATLQRMRNTLGNKGLDTLK